MSETEYDTRYPTWLTAAGITPGSDPVSFKGSFHQVLQWIGNNNPTYVHVVNAVTNAGTIPVTSMVNNFFNSSAATMTITMATTGAVDGQFSTVRIYDFSAAAETITWVNTENGLVTASTTSAGSTTLPITNTFQFNGATSKWRTYVKA